MKRKILNLLLLVGCGVLLAGVAFLQIAPQNTPATVSLQGPTQVRIGDTFTLFVRVDLTGVTTPGSNQPAALGSYVIPISFDRSLLEFVSAGGGETPAFAAGPASVTNALTANARGVLTLVGAQTASDAVTGVVGAASVRLRVIATQAGSTTVSVHPALAAPGLSLASAVRLGMPAEPDRIAAVNQTSTIQIIR